MQYTVTIVELAMSGHRSIIGAHRAAVEHLFHPWLASGAMIVVGDGTLRMPEPPARLDFIAHIYSVLTRLAEAQAIDEAMRSKSEAANAG